MAGIADPYLRRFQGGGPRRGHAKLQGMWDGMNLIPGRDCGGCTVCCRVPTVDKPEIQKLSGALCRHCAATGCTIYEARPPVCRSYYCAWRTVDIFGDDWRPDRSGVLPYVQTQSLSQAFSLPTGLRLILLAH